MMGCGPGAPLDKDRNLTNVSYAHNANITSTYDGTTERGQLRRLSNFADSGADG